jgi:pyridoxamine 5'-phosphate oxidase
MAHLNEFLPDDLPAEPFTLFSEWFDTAHAARSLPNANAMVLATVDHSGNPSARVVLCKEVVRQPGYIVFFTNYRSDKGRQLERLPRAAVVFHWDSLHRQVRMSGPVVKSPVAESDDYFAQRALGNRVGAWASRQSERLESRAQLAQQVDEVRRRFHVATDASEANIPRPPHWGGYRLFPEQVELWIEGPGRVHDRAVWSRSIHAKDEFTFVCGSWSATRLNP